MAKIVRQRFLVNLNAVSKLDNTTFKSLESSGTINLLGNNFARGVQKYYRDREYNISTIQTNLEVYFYLIKPLMLEFPADRFVIKGHLQDVYCENADLKKLYGMFNGILTSRLFNLNVRKRLLELSIDKTQKLIARLNSINIT